MYTLNAKYLSITYTMCTKVDYLKFKLTAMFTLNVYLNIIVIFQVCKVRHLLMLRRKLSKSEHDLSSTHSSVLSEDSVCSDECDKHTESESMINNGKTDKVHEILDKVRVSLLGPVW